MSDVTISLGQGDVAMTKLFPLVHDRDLEWKQLKHLVRGQEPQQLELICDHMTVTSLAPTSLYEDYLTKLNLSIAKAKVEQSLEDKLSDCIPFLEEEERDYTVAAATEVITLEVNGQRKTHFSTEWASKAHNLPYGSDAIYLDLTSLCAQLRDQMGVSLTHSSNHLTLVVPANQFPYLLAKTKSCESALNLFKKLLPEVELVTVPKLYDKRGKPCALLLCTSDAFGPVGYTVFDQPVSLKQDGHDNYTLTIPEHKLVIVNPTQMAVLTGI